jgi:hypothetical protein
MAGQIQNAVIFTPDRWRAFWCLLAVFFLGWWML